MKNIFLVLVLLVSISNFSQEIPNVELENSDGGITSTETILQTTDKPIIMTFWATWCIPCLTELSSINENYYLLFYKEKEEILLNYDQDKNVILKLSFIGLS